MVLHIGSPKATEHHVGYIRHNYCVISLFSHLKESEVQASLCCNSSEESNIKAFLTVENKDYVLHGHVKPWGLKSQNPLGSDWRSVEDPKLTELRPDCWNDTWHTLGQQALPGYYHRYCKYAQAKTSRAHISSETNWKIHMSSLQVILVGKKKSSKNTIK